MNVDVSHLIVVPGTGMSFMTSKEYKNILRVSPMLTIVNTMTSSQDMSFRDENSATKRFLVLKGESSMPWNFI